MNAINFQPIFDYLDNHFKITLKEEIMSEVRAEFREVKTTLANLAADVKKHNEEFAVTNYRMNRMEDWAKPAGDKIGIPFAT